MADHIELSKKDRLFLSNQLEILKNQHLILRKLNEQEASLVDISYYDNLIKALREGYELHYGDAFEDIYDGLSYDDCRFVLDILEMYRGITYSFLALERANKLDRLTKEQIKFDGFDLNTETKYFSYAKYFLIDFGRYREIRDIVGPYYDFNSHTSLTLPKYKRQLDIWKSYLSLDTRYQMSEEEICKILDV